MTDKLPKLLAAAEGTSAATTDLIDAAREGGEITGFGNIGCGDTLAQLADSMRLLIEVMPDMDEREAQLSGALARYLEAQG